MWRGYPSSIPSRGRTSKLIVSQHFSQTYDTLVAQFFRGSDDFLVQLVDLIAFGRRHAHLPLQLGPQRQLFGHYGDQRFVPGFLEHLRNLIVISLG